MFKTLISQKFTIIDIHCFKHRRTKAKVFYIFSIKIWNKKVKYRIFYNQNFNDWHSKHQKHLKFWNGKKTQNILFKICNEYNNWEMSMTMHKWYLCPKSFNRPSIKQKRRDCEDIVNRRSSWPFTRTIIVPSFPPRLEHNERFPFFRFLPLWIGARARPHPLKGTSAAVMEIRQCSLHVSSRAWLALNGNNTNGRSHFRVSLFSIRPFQLTRLHKLG